MACNDSLSLISFASPCNFSLYSSSLMASSFSSDGVFRISEANNAVDYYSSDLQGCYFERISVCNRNFPHGITCKENLLKECEEEAGIQRSISNGYVSLQSYLIRCRGRELQVDPCDSYCKYHSEETIFQDALVQKIVITCSCYRA